MSITYPFAMERSHTIKNPVMKERGTATLLTEQETTHLFANPVVLE